MVKDVSRYIAKKTLFELFWDWKIPVVEQLRERGLSIYDALIHGGLVRLRPILMTAFTTSFALIPLAVFASDEGVIIGAELATVVIGGLASSTFLTLIIVPVVYTLVHSSLPRLFRVVGSNLSMNFFRVTIFNRYKHRHNRQDSEQIEYGKVRDYLPKNKALDPYGSGALTLAAIR